MTLIELKATLSSLGLGKAAGINHDVYADLFPPGEPDERAREACFKFAKSHGCRIENNPKQQTVWFIKDA
jgi:hypothetical protein